MIGPFEDLLIVFDLVLAEADVGETCFVTCPGSEDAFGALLGEFDVVIGGAGGIGVAGDHGFARREFAGLSKAGGENGEGGDVVGGGFSDVVVGEHDGAIEVEVKIFHFEDEAFEARDDDLVDLGGLPLEDQGEVAAGNFDLSHELSRLSRDRPAVFVEVRKFELAISRGDLFAAEGGGGGGTFGDGSVGFREFVGFAEKGFAVFVDDLDFDPGEVGFFGGRRVSCAGGAAGAFAVLSVGREGAALALGGR